MKMPPKVFFGNEIVKEQEKFAKGLDTKGLEAFLKMFLPFYHIHY
jgi:hypothetical protein